MKKIIFVLVVLLLVIGYTHDQFLWCKKLFSNDPQTHTIQKGEYLSAIAKKYYGDPDYWRELALINRAPNSNLVFPGEEVIVPRLSVIKEIRRTRYMSKVNAFIQDETNILARLDRHDIEETYFAESRADTIQTTAAAAQIPAIEPAAAPEPETKSAASFYIYGGIAVLFLATLLAFRAYRSKRRSEKFTFAGRPSNGADDDNDTEPDYQEYLRKKSSRGKKKVPVK
ncbi:MAG: LysM peptidoglycan-binding domain-containing protein [Candidatus Zhuqueibacterota bacterium]